MPIIEKSSPPPYELPKFEEDYESSRVTLQSAIKETRASASLVESCFKSVENRFVEARDASAVFRPDIQEFCNSWSGFYQVYFYRSVLFRDLLQSLEIS